MDSIISQFIAEWGTFGLLLFGIAYISCKRQIDKRKYKNFNKADYGF